MPAKRVTINLGPANVKKSGPAFDLPIAMAILLADGQLEADIADIVVVGELALDGSLRPVRGILPITSDAAQRGRRQILVPAANAGEAAVVEGIEVLAASSLTEVIGHLSGEAKLTPVTPTPVTVSEQVLETDFSDIRGQAVAKRALEIAAAGGHNVLMAGPPGTGKTLLAKALPGILPPLKHAEMLEVTAIWSVAGLLPSGSSLLTQRPFRAPHHSISLPALIGGGSLPKPGEISLAHRGVLYLDELPQFAPATMEAIRGPLEDRKVRVSRSHYSSEFPSACMVIASQNPCPCGFADDPERTCRCSPGVVARYQQRVSGPIRDRFDLLIGVPRVHFEETRRPDAESSAVVRARVAQARLRQRQRYGTDLLTNAGLSVRNLDRYCAVTKSASGLIRQAAERWHLSVRSIHRILKVARTISDLAGDEAISDAAVAEALSYRSEAALV
jgi:magnesium chelatase family protein